jgi:hypothetical protein
MDKLDLNMEHYELEDILNLFKVPLDLDANHLKEAKKIVLKTHPDKSGLPPKYFLFFSKAYKVIYEIWEFKNKQEKQLSNIEYKTNVETFTVIDKSKKTILDGYLKKENMKDPKQFNSWFNEQFEKNKTSVEEETHGYGEWLKSDNDLPDNQDIHFSQMGAEIERKKQQLRSLTVYKGVDDINSFYKGATSVTGDAPESFGSDLFSSLQYEDLRKAHTETVVPVTIEDYQNVKKFKDVNEYSSYRNDQNIVPLSEIQAREYLSNKEKIQEHQSTERAYKLAKQLEESQKKQENYWASLRYISNK